MRKGAFQKRVKEDRFNLFILKSSLLEQEIDHDEFYGDTWEDKEDECLPYVKNDVLSTAFCYARYTIGMRKTTNFSIK